MYWLQRSCLAGAILFVFLSGFAGMALAAGAEHVTLEIPYSLGLKQTTAAPGETFRALFNIENNEPQGQQSPVTILLPKEISVSGPPEHWQISSVHGGGVELSRIVQLAGGYGQWFDLLSLKVDENAAVGNYRLHIRTDKGEKDVFLTVASRVGNPPLHQKPVLERIVLPLDRDGKLDEKQSGNALVLRDRSLDYYKNVFRGKGASNLEIEAIHPITHMGLDFRNPAGVQKLIMVEAELLDLNTRRHVPGLYTPGSNSDNDGAGAMAANQERLTAFAALNGEIHQRLQLPVYADENLITEGRYLLRVTVEDDESQMWSAETPVAVIKQNMRGLATLGASLVFLILFLAVLAKKMPGILAEMKTRRLITIALFGTCAFAAVNVPSTLLNDFFHIFLGPFSFLLTGMFSGVMLYMLIGALVTLIPLYGAVSLLMAIRLLLGMVAFGHMSPIVLLSYGINAFLLESVLALSGFTQSHLSDTSPVRMSCRRMVMLAFSCALADTAATYVSLQGMSVLYRLYYADWYILTVMAVNGFLYTMIGAVCGVWLGGRLADVGSD